MNKLLAGLMLLVTVFLAINAVVLYRLTNKLNELQSNVSTVAGAIEQIERDVNTLGGTTAAAAGKAAKRVENMAREGVSKVIQDLLPKKRRVDLPIPPPPSQPD